jgi:hypothetical protein
MKNCAPPQKKQAASSSGQQVEALGDTAKNQNQRDHMHLSRYIRRDSSMDRGASFRVYAFNRNRKAEAATRSAEMVLQQV